MNALESLYFLTILVVLMVIFDPVDNRNTQSQNGILAVKDLLNKL